MSLGYTHEQIDEMTLPMLRELNKYWEMNPPQHLLVKYIAISLGAFKPADVVEKEKQGDDIGKLMADTNWINGRG